jgi:Spy/CpxP family protein refolding chaperone
MKKLILMVWMAVLTAAHVSAQSQDMEFTPGPRMIRAIEQIAGSYVHLGLGLTTQQKAAMAGLVQRIKTEMWMKEAVLVGMFQELEEKRRHGLLQDNEYRIANTLTGGIETDELNLFIETLAGLRAVLSADQQAKLRESWHPTMAFRVSQGFNTRIGLMSLDGIGRIYNAYRDDLRLTDDQAREIQSLLEAARREVLRLGTEIDLSRVEADELVMRPDVDPQSIRAKMQTTGETEGVLFNKLFETSDRIEALLTDEQRKKHGELKQARQRHGGAGDGSGRTGAGHGNRSGAHAGSSGFDYFLGETGRLGLTPRQIGDLVAAKNETRKAVLIEQAKFKAAELTLLNVLRDQDGDTPVPQDKIDGSVQSLEEIRGRITKAKALGYLKARGILTAEQQQRVHPPRTLEDGQ